MIRIKKKKRIRMNKDIGGKKEGGCEGGRGVRGRRDSGKEGEEGRQEGRKEIPCKIKKLKLKNAAKSMQNDNFGLRNGADTMQSERFQFPNAAYTVSSERF